MRVMVCGSREWNDPEPIRRRLSRLPRNTATVIHGGARGADTLAGQTAEELGLKVEVFLPDWGTYGRRAGIKRNIDMLDTQPDLVIAFWIDDSPGTRHAVTEAGKRGIPVEVEAKGGST